jgi:phosphoglycerol geranylgeranyltransferase
MNQINLDLSKKNQIAILLDPEETNSILQFINRISQIEQNLIDYLFIGGSTATRAQIEQTILLLKKNTKIPLIIFPGSPEQFSNQADAILFLSLISGRNPYYLIDSQIQAATEIYNSGISTISTSYILIDGENISSVEKISKTKPINSGNISLIYKTALAGKLMGHQAIYLEAGSGAKTTVPYTAIEQCSHITEILIVGGGVRTIKQIEELHKYGAKIVVIGNHIESDPEFIHEIQDYKKINPTY